MSANKEQERINETRTMNNGQKATTFESLISFNTDHSFSNTWMQKVTA